MAKEKTLPVPDAEPATVEEPPVPEPTRVKFGIDRDTVVDAFVESMDPDGTTAHLYLADGRKFSNVRKTVAVPNMSHAVPVGAWRHLTEEEE